MSKKYIEGEAAEPKAKLIQNIRQTEQALKNKSTGLGRLIIDLGFIPGTNQYRLKLEKRLKSISDARWEIDDIKNNLKPDNKPEI